MSTLLCCPSELLEIIVSYTPTLDVGRLRRVSVALYDLCTELLDHRLANIPWTLLVYYNTSWGPKHQINHCMLYLGNATERYDVSSDDIDKKERLRIVTGYGGAIVTQGLLNVPELSFRAWFNLHGRLSIELPERDENSDDRAQTHACVAVANLDLPDVGLPLLQDRWEPTFPFAVGRSTKQIDHDDVFVTQAKANNFLDIHHKQRKTKAVKRHRIESDDQRVKRRRLTIHEFEYVTDIFTDGLPDSDTEDYDY